MLFLQLAHASAPTLLRQSQEKQSPSHQQPLEVTLVSVPVHRSRGPGGRVVVTVVVVVRVVRVVVVVGMVTAGPARMQTRPKRP